MSKLSGILALLALLLVAFGLGAYMAISRHWGQSSVTIEIANHSGRPIQSLVLDYSTCGSDRGSIVGGLLAEGQARTMHFDVCGEGGYSISATFPDGQRLSSKGDYVESGYVVTATVLHDSIDSSARIYGF